MNELSDINQIEVKINYLKQQTAMNIIEIGVCLNEAKKQVPHGQWGTWLKDKVKFSHQQANRFMRVAEEFPNSSALSNLGQSKVFALLELPEEQRLSFIEEHKDVDLTTREWQIEINELKKENSILKNKESKIIEKEVIKEVEVIKEIEVIKIPSDYNQLKDWKDKSVSQEHFDKTELELNKVNLMNSKLSNENRQLRNELPKTEYDAKLKQSIMSFNMASRDFIEDVGGFVWLSDAQDDLEPFEKKLYINTVNLLYGYVMNLKQQIKEE